MLAKRSNLKLKSVTIIHSATTETVRLPDDNNGVIVHTAVRTKVPFKKKVRGERSSSSNNPANSNGNKSKVGGSKITKNANKSSHIHNRGSKVNSTNNANLPANTTATANATNAGAVGEVKKPIRTKKNRVSGSAGKSAHNVINAVVNAEKASQENLKKSKKKKHNKEIIDYSSRTGPGIGGAPINHTNTFGKVQKWLLESPIVAQPLSHIEHSSKVRKVMSKSQSTPERLVQKTPTKSKSMGNLSNEKVKLQVVYKPPFRFALRLSKNTKVKTHVMGNISNNKFKRHSRTDNKRSSGSHQMDGSGGAGSGSGSGGGGVKALGEKTKRAALLLRSNNDEDNQILTLNEPNYETLNPKTAPSKMENPFYENMKFIQTNEKRHSDPSVAADSGTASASGGSVTNSVKRSSSKSNLEAHQQPQHFQRSSSSSNPFAAMDSSRNSRKLSESNADNLSRNFGSTQNLINSSQSNLSKTKKRSSLNLKTTLNKNGKDPPLSSNMPATKRSNSNMNLRRDSSTNAVTENPKVSKHLQTQAVPLRRSISSSTHTNQTNGGNPLAKSSSSSSTPASAANAALALPTQLPSYNAQRSSRASFSNIPRASLSLVNTSSSSSTGSNSPANLNTSHTNFPFNSQASTTAHNMQGRNRSSLPPPPLQQANGHQRSNSVRQHAHNYHPPPLPSSSNINSVANSSSNKSQSNSNNTELPSDLEVMVSDIENLVS